MKRKVLTNEQIEVLTKDSVVVIKWLMEKFPKLLGDFMTAFTVMIKTSQTIPMDALFKPLIVSGVVIPANVLTSLTTFTQTTTLYTTVNTESLAEPVSTNF